MKVYDYQWAASFGMDAATAAGELVRDGIDTVLVRNQIDPLPTSGVDQEAYLASGAFVSVATDRAWSDALRAAGLRVYQTTALFFDPELLQSFPDARPVDANGDPDIGFDWYLGICPTHDGYLAAKIDRLQRVAAELEPDGLFLSFTRYPGFWENWVPGYTFTNADRFCFCLGVAPGLPQIWTSTSLLAMPRPRRASSSKSTARHGLPGARRIVAVIDASPPRFAPRVLTSRSCSTLGVSRPDFDGLDVRREIAAQDLGMLRGSVDRFELMTYLQILDRPDSWLEIVADARRALPDRPLYCTLQVAPLYTDGIHAGRGGQEITAEELDHSARAALVAGADGLVFYHWTDFLVDEAAGGRKRAVLRGFPVTDAKPNRLGVSYFGNRYPITRVRICRRWHR